MNGSLTPVHWTLPGWAAELILETLKLDSESPAFDPRLRKQLAAALAVVVAGKSKTTSAPPNSGFDLFRLSKSKQTVDLCPNTLRAYQRQGLPFYRQGRAIFVSKTELAVFLRTHSNSVRKSVPPKT
jgi:hypothetical protein